MISFDTVPGSIRVPGRYIEFNTRTAVQGLPQNPQKMALIAPMLAGGSQPPLKPVQLFSDAQAADLFGAGSWAHLAVRQAFRNNAYLDLTVIGVADHSGGVAAGGSVAVSGSATGVGVATITLAGKDYTTAVGNGDTAAAIATRLRGLLSDPDSPVAAAGSAASITLTAKCKGEIGNELALATHSTAKGIVLTATALAGGATNADIAPALTTIAGKRYHIIASAFSQKAVATHRIGIQCH